MSTDSEVELSKERLKQYKFFESLPLTSPDLNSVYERFVTNLNGDSLLVTKVLADLGADDRARRYGSCYLLGRLLDQSVVKRSLSLSSSQLSDMISSIVLSLSNATDSKEASQILWTLKRDALVGRTEIKPHVVTILYACQRAATDIKSDMANRSSYSVAVSILQLMCRLYDAQPEIMKSNTKIWFSLTLSYCCHANSRLLRVNSQELIELSYEHLLSQATTIRSIVSDISENVVANITNVIEHQYEEPCKLFAIKLWGLLVSVLGEELESMHVANLYLSALSRAFSKNYPTRQAAAFLVWKQFIQNMSSQFLLTPVVRKHLAVPLTKGNRVDDSRALVARLECWWTLIRRLGSRINDLFIEICKPMMEFCVATSITPVRPLGASGLKSSSLIAGPPKQDNLLQMECLAATLQFLGQSDTVLIPYITLGVGQKEMKLTSSTLKYCGKVLLQAVSESLRYLSSDVKLKNKDEVQSLLLKAFSQLVSYLTELKTDEQPMRDLIRQVFSLIISNRQRVSEHSVLDLVCPAAGFGTDVLSSTAYTPTDVSSITKTPAMCLLELLMKGSGVTSNQESMTRYGECVCTLIRKGFANSPASSSTLAELAQVLDVDRLRAVTSAGLLTEVTDAVELRIPLYQQLILKSSSLSCVLPALTEDLLKIFRLEDVSDPDQILELWRSLAGKLSRFGSSIDTEVSESVLLILQCTLRHRETSLRDVTIELWENTMSKHVSLESNEEFRRAIAEVCPNKQTAEVTVISALPPTPDNAGLTGRKKLKSSSHRKQLIIPSPSQSPRRVGNKRQLVLCERSGSSRVNGNTEMKDTDSHGLLDGLVTPEKRRKLTEQTPTKANSPVGIRGGLKGYKGTPTRKTGGTGRVSDVVKNEDDGRAAVVMGNGGDGSIASVVEGVDNANLASVVRSGGRQKTLAGESLGEKKPVCQPPDMDEDLAIPLSLSSQSIEDSPIQSQLISEFDELEKPDFLDCQSAVSEKPRILEKCGNAITDERSVSLTPKQPIRRRLTAQTPGYPVTSPVHESPTNLSAQASRSPTPPLTFSKKAISSSAAIPKLATCSVSITKMDSSQVAIIDSQCIEDSFEADSSQQNSRAKRPSRRTKMVKRLISEEDSQTANIDSSQKSTSVSQSQTYRSKQKKTLSAGYSSSIINQKSASYKSKVKMIADVMVDLIKCSNVAVIKSAKSQMKRRSDELCSSQESQSIYDVSTDTTIDIGSSQKSQGSSQNSQNSNSGERRRQRERPPGKPKVSAPIDSPINVPTLHDQTAARIVTLKEVHSYFDEISSQYSLFEESESQSPVVDKIMGSSSIQAGSLKFSDTERVTLSGNVKTSSQDTTPIPPRNISKARSEDQTTPSSLSLGSSTDCTLSLGDDTSRRSPVVCGKLKLEKAVHAVEKRVDDEVVMKSGADIVKRNDQEKKKCQEKIEYRADLVTLADSTMHDNISCSQTIEMVLPSSSLPSGTPVRKKKKNMNTGYFCLTDEQAHKENSSDLESVNKSVTELDDEKVNVASKTVEMGPDDRSKEISADEFSDELFTSMDSQPRLSGDRTDKGSVDDPLAVKSTVKSGTPVRKKNERATSFCLADEQTHKQNSSDLEVVKKAVSEFDDERVNAASNLSKEICSDEFSDELFTNMDSQPSLSDDNTDKGSVDDRLTDKSLTKSEDTEEIVAEKEECPNASLDNEIADDDISLSQFDEEMEIPSQSSQIPTSVLSIPPESATSQLHPTEASGSIESSADFIVSEEVHRSSNTSSPTDREEGMSTVTHTCSNEAERTSSANPTKSAKLTLVIESKSKDEARTIDSSKTIDGQIAEGYVSTPLRLKVLPSTKVMKCKPSPVSASPSRAEKMLKMASMRSTQILAMSSKQGTTSPSPGGMTHVDTLPATPKSRKLNVEALELDCTPIYSPSTGSILKRKSQRSPVDSSMSKKVKFRLPEGDAAGSARKLQKRVAASNDESILAMYADSGSAPSEQKGERPQTPDEAPDCAKEQDSQSQVTPKDPPIASEYTESTVAIDAMIPHLNLAVWQGNLKQCLISQGITTVGAMALLTESDVELLPIRVPKLSTTLKAFKKSGAAKSNPKPKAKRLPTVTRPSSLTEEQMANIMKLVTDKQLTDSQLGSEIRSILISEGVTDL